MSNKKGVSALAMATTIVLVAVAMVIGVWIISAMQGAVILPSQTVTESLTFVNATAKAVAYPYVSAITSIANTTQTLLAANYSTDGTYITVTALCKGATTACDLSLPYTVTYTYNPQAANTTMGTVMSTTWSSFQLGVVALIVIAAVAIIGILVSGFGKSAGE
jgi:hypothetical protein